MRRWFIFCSFVVLLAFGGSALAQGQPTTEPFTYAVQPGDTLYRIATTYGTTVNAILAANNLSDPNLLSVGQRLIIPPMNYTPPAPTLPAPTQAPPTRTPNVCAQQYTVLPNETLGRIASRFGLTTRQLADANNITNLNLVVAGQTLCIPGVGDAVPTSLPPAIDPTIIPTDETEPDIPAPTDTPPPPTAAPPTVGFDIGGQAFTLAYPEQMRAAGMTFAKRDIRWLRGTDATEASVIIEQTRAVGFRILLSITGDPAELTVDPSGYFTAFAAYLGQVASLNPDAIEVWHGQNIEANWGSSRVSPALYSQMLASAYGAIKTVNPNVLVISGAPTPTNAYNGACTANGCDDDAYIRGLAAAGTGNFADCIGIRYIDGAVSPDVTSGDRRPNAGHYSHYFPALVNLYASVFPNKPLCFTAFGYLTAEGFGPLPAGYEWAANTRLQDQAEWLARAAVLSRQSGRIRLMIVWNIDATRYDTQPDAGYAIVRNNQCLACLTLGTVMMSR